MDEVNNHTSRYRYDAFISYRRIDPDQSFARDLCAKLERAGYKVAIDERDFILAAHFLTEMERCVRESRFTLAVVSPRFFDSGHTHQESIIGQVRDMDERRYRLIPLILEPAKMPAWLSGIVGIDFFSKKPFVDPFKRLLSALVQPVAGEGISGETSPEPTPSVVSSEKPRLPPIENIHGWPEQKVQALQRQTAQAKNLSVVFRDRLEGPEMVVIPAGAFLMGSPEDEKGRSAHEQQHEVKLMRPFALGKYPVTFIEYERFVKDTPRDEPDDENRGRGHRPAINVSRDDAVAYAEWLSAQTGETYRLPTEAEWEYAARAGSSTAYCFGDDPGRLGEYAWYMENSGPRTHPVGEKKPNAWGLYDMHGSVWEWVADWYDNNYYANSPVENPAGPDAGSAGTVRGGGWFNDTRLCRSAFRARVAPGDRARHIGFRLSRLL